MQLKGNRVKESLLNIAIETIGDVLMIIIALVIAYYVKIQFI